MSKNTTKPSAKRYRTPKWVMERRRYLEKAAKWDSVLRTVKLAFNVLIILVVATTIIYYQDLAVSVGVLLLMGIYFKIK